MNALKQTSSVKLIVSVRRTKCAKCGRLIDGSKNDGHIAGNASQAAPYTKLQSIADTDSDSDMSEGWMACR